MDRLTLVVYLCMLQIHTTSSPLPDIAQRVDSCPEPNNKAAWERASKRMNCSEFSDKYSIEIIKTLLFYHCLPSHHLNETIEFCGRSAAIPKGNCPIYNYKYGATVATGISCVHFSRGCPDPKDSPYHSWTFYIYYACYDINREHRCYHADPKCPQEKRSDTTEASATTDIASTTTLSTNYPEVENSSPLWTIIGVLIFIIVVFVFCAVLGLVCFIRDRKQRLRKRMHESREPKSDIRHDIEDSNSIKEDVDEDPQEITELQSLMKNDEIGDSNDNSSQISVSGENDKNTHSKHATKDFLIRIFGCMKDETLEFIKTVLKGMDIMDENSLKEMDSATVYFKMSDVLKLEFNMSFLAWIFAEKEEYRLAEECKSFSHWENIDLEPFKTRITPGSQSRHLQFRMNEVDISEYNHVIDCLEKWLAKYLRVHRGKILMTALETNPLVITYRMDLQNSETILNFLRTDDGLTEASRKNVETVVEIQSVIPIAKPVIGENFIHVHLKSEARRITERDIKNASLLITQNLGVKTEGKEVYLRVSNDNTRESLIFIEKYKKSLMENLEPCSLLKNHDIASLFDEGTVSNINGKKSRREKVDYFLDMCKGLPKRQFDVVLPHLEKSVSSSKSITSSKECDAIRSWIQENRENVIEEMDSDIINTTCNMNNMEAVSTEIGAMLSAARGRKEKAEVFLDFALRNDEYLKALKKTLEEIGMRVGSD